MCLRNGEGYIKIDLLIEFQRTNGSVEMKSSVVQTICMRHFLSFCCCICLLVSVVKAQNSENAKIPGTRRMLDDVTPPGALHLILTEFVVSPTAGEFIEVYNPDAAPFQWQRKTVRQTTLQPSYANFVN